MADLNGLVAGIATLLKADGTAALEMPYVVDLLDGCEFDTIYHQHLCYFSVTALDQLFRRHSLIVNDPRRLDIHGGALRLYVSRRDTVGSLVSEHSAEERARGSGRIEAYQAFADRVRSLRTELVGLIRDLKAAGAGESSAMGRRQSHHAARLLRLRPRDA